MISNVFNIDCMEGLKEFPDKFFELAIECVASWIVGYKSKIIKLKEHLK